MHPRSRRGAVMRRRSNEIRCRSGALQGKDNETGRARGTESIFINMTARLIATC